MAKTLQVVRKSELKIDETVTGVSQNVGQVTYGHDIGSNGTLNASTDPDATEGWTGRVTLSGTTGTLDLAALPYAGDRADVDATGLKVVEYKFFCPLTNSAVMRIEGNDAGNPYELFGDADTEIQLHPGEDEVRGMQNGGGAWRAAVGALAKELLFTGTSGDVVDITLVFGDDNP